MDASDKKILGLLQINATLSLAEISRRVGLSKTPCWNRIKSLEEKGIITNRITVLDRKNRSTHNNILINICEPAQL